MDLMLSATTVHPKDNGGWLTIVRHLKCGRYLHPNVPIPMDQLCDCPLPPHTNAEDEVVLLLVH